MTSEPESPPDPDQRKSLSLKALAAAGLLLLLFGLILFGTLRGCAAENPQDVAKREEEQKKKEEEEKKKQEDQEDPKIDDPVVMPNESPFVEQYVKPGHWVIASQHVMAKFRDFVGRAQTSVVDGNRNVLPIERTPFLLRSTRPAALAKGTTKNVESTFFVPPSASTIMLSTAIEEGALGMTRGYYATLRPMFPHQYHLVVLAKEIDRYALVKTLDSVQPPFNGLGNDDGTNSMVSDAPVNLHYRVDLLKVDRDVPLPDSPLMWTSIAYLVWDEVDPTPFTEGQERALIDWLHWGGQLIVNGPDSLDLIKGSFLEPYMPATSGGPREITADDLETFNDHWMISTSRARGQPIVPTAPWSGIKLVPVSRSDFRSSFENGRTPDPLWDSTGGLLAERAVGRGRIVVSAMQLTERELVDWRSGFDSWFNACLLRRPPREYRSGTYGKPTLLWDATADPSLANRRLDARLTSRLHYFARDLGIDTIYRPELAQDDANQWTIGPAFGRRTRTTQPPLTSENRPTSNAVSVGAWNDFNATANAAREALRKAAGVDVPNATFVVVCLAAYLIVLVPLNWLVFHMLGRVEWAWIAAPLIAIIGTFVVVDRARLDIGFVRSQTEIGLLELQPDHPRGHLSRYTALYTSLSTTYGLEFDDATALAMPFPRDASEGAVRGRTTLDFQRQERVHLTGLPVLSNSTNLVHSEQMFTLDGTIRIGQSTVGGWQLENHSQLALRSIGIIKKDGNALRGVWIGELEPGRSAAMGHPNRLPKLPSGAAPFVTQRAEESQRQGSLQLNLEPLFRLACDRQHMEEGEWRLVARVDEPLPGETVSPAASQLRSGTLVIAHLSYAPLPAPQPDRNTRQDVAIANEDDLEV